MACQGERTHFASIRKAAFGLFPCKASSAWLLKATMHTRRALPFSSSAASATAAVRALSSTLLLLGLIGDRRAR
jgi:hypothetical protein